MEKTRTVKGHLTTSLIFYLSITPEISYYPRDKKTPSLSKKPYHLSMTSKYQNINMGIIDADLLHYDGRGCSIPINIDLSEGMPPDIIYAYSEREKFYQRKNDITVQFLSYSINNNKYISTVNKTSGIGLEITDKKGKCLPFGEITVPSTLLANQPILTYYITPVLIGKLNPNTYSAVIDLEINYY